MSKELVHSAWPMLPDHREWFLEEAWHDLERFQVLADSLLEGGLEIKALTGSIRRASAPSRDDGLYDLECAVREWMIRQRFGEGFELRVTGAWPDLRFVVCAKDDPAGFVNRATFAGVEEQPRLLRAEVA